MGDVDDAILEDMLHCDWCGAPCDVSDITLFGSVALCDDCGDRDSAGLLVTVVRLRTALASIRDQAAHSRVEWHHLPGIIDQIRQKADTALAPQSGAEQNVPAGAPRMPLDGLEARKADSDTAKPATGQKRQQTEGYGQ